MEDIREPVDENDLFFFESDHLALRGNKDYSDLLKTIFVLEAQRQQAIVDYNTVVALKKSSLEDPIVSVENLRAGTLGLPELQRITEIPRINWSKYKVNVPEQYIKQINTEKVESPVKHGVSKEKTLMKPWTTEEQRKLEELLVKYPPEEIESKRIKKIAIELGTRTEKQVASRLQKYYLKLIKAGLPIPGKLPKSKGYEKRIPGKNKSKYNYKKFTRPSTFFPDLEIPVVMNELEEVPGPSSSARISDTSTANPSNYLLPNNYHEDKVETLKDDLELQLELVKRIKAEKQREETDLQGFQHYGYKCDYCDDDPITGSRWHCSSCISSSVDFCTDCMLSQLCSTSPHPLQHKIIIIRNEKEIVDSFHSDTESLCEGSTQNGESVLDSSEESDSEDEDDSESTSNLMETPPDTTFTDTQNESYSYLHSNLLMDDS